MFERIKQFFEGDEATELDQRELAEEELRIACCVLLLETAFVDFRYPTSEQEMIRQIVIEQFSLGEAQAQNLMDLAGAAKLKEQKISRFVDLINERLDDAQRQTLYATVWKVIKADQVVDQREVRLATKMGKALGLTLDQEVEARKLVIEGRV